MERTAPLTTHEYRNVMSYPVRTSKTQDQQIVRAKFCFPTQHQIGKSECKMRQLEA